MYTEHQRAIKGSAITDNDTNETDRELIEYYAEDMPVYTSFT